MKSLDSERFVLSWLLSVAVFLCFGCNKPGTEEKNPNASHKAQSEGVASSETQEEDPVVAKVGPLEIRLSEVLEVTREKEEVACAVREGDTIEDVRKETRKTFLRRIIDKRLLALRGAEHPDWVGDASVEAEVRKRLKDMGPKESERRRKLAGLTKEGFAEDFTKYVREEMMQNAIIQREVDSKLGVGEEELRQRYDRDLKESFYRPDSWSIYHIEKYLPRERREELPILVEEMERIRHEVSLAIESATTHQAQAERMAPFVKQYSEAPSAQSGYVYLYDTPKAQFDPAFVSRVKGSIVGDLSPVFELAGDENRVGVCFFLVFDHRPGEYAPYDLAKRPLRGKMLEEQRSALIARMFENLEREFPVAVYEARLFQGLGPSG